MLAGTAVLMGLAALILHWFSEFVHQLGHAVARRGENGHPMIGIRFWGLLSTALYPNDEPPLPADVHIRQRAGRPNRQPDPQLLRMGAYGSHTDRGRASLVGGSVLFSRNAVVFTLQAFIPLGFNDGATLWYWLRKR